MTQQRVEINAQMGPHVNRLPFTGVLTFVDTPSTTAPTGARGHRVILTCEAAQKALPSLLGMGISYALDFKGHAPQNKIGIITTAGISDKNELVISGFLFSKDFGAIICQIRHTYAARLGMSYEVSDAKVEDVSSRIWKLTEVTFTGAVVGVKAKMAYSNTSFIVV